MNGLHAGDSPLWSAVAWLAVAAAGAALGRGLTAAMRLLLGPADDSAGRSWQRVFDRATEAVAIAVALGLWWWEVHARGQLPAAAVGDAAADGGVLACRYAAHVVLFTFLAAASIVDFRYRVIPDIVTVPGVLLGLLWITVHPDSLLPIVVEEPRSFGLPLLKPDVLGLFGGLHAVRLPQWLGGRPAPVGLASALATYGAWWLVCTAPWYEPATHGAGRRPGPLAEPRNALLLSGVVGIVATWWCGGDHWHGLLTSLAGLIVSGGMIWLTRAGASRALGREAMGLGDVTLMAMVGAWLGWQPCVLVCVLAVFIGLVHGVMQAVLRRESELPFGPSLCLATVLVVLLWEPLWSRLGASFARPLEIVAVVVAVIVLTALSLAI